MFLPAKLPSRAGHQRLSKAPEMSTKMAMTYFFWEVVARLWNLVRASVVDLPDTKPCYRVEWKRCDVLRSLTLMSLSRKRNIAKFIRSTIWGVQLKSGDN
jgi:hypothetical protein